MFRLLLASFVLFFAAAQDTCTALNKDEATCLGTAKVPSDCNWCESPDSNLCLTWADVMKLPAGKNCGNFSRTDCENLASTQAECEQLTACSWCVSAAVKPKCNGWQQASRLPPSIFACKGPY